MILCDPAAERAVLSGIFQYGEEVYLDIDDILNEKTFTIDSNQYIYQCLSHILSFKDSNSDSKKIIDIASIYSAAQELGISQILQKKEEVQHLQAIRDFPVDKTNVRKFATKIKKLELARNLYKTLGDAQEKLLDISGTESISSIIGIAEDSVLDFSTGLADNSTDPEKISTNIDSYITNLIDNPIQQMGIPTGFPVYDSSIGGGLRKSTINVIAARPKVGKTLLSDNMGFHIANKFKIPVLNMDTEMTKEDHIHRLLAMSSEVELSKIETGKFSETPAMKEKILQSVEDLKNTPIYHKSIAGKPFDEQIAMMKRWLVKEVGLNDDGSAKDCVIFYDYLKLMDSAGISQDMKEYQVLGFMMTALHNFACKYKLPIVAFIQLNRDGITKESTDTASGSDRIIWLCSNFTIFKRKSDEEIAEDGSESGNRKLIPIISRHGPGLGDNDYINCHMKGWCAKITEAQTRIELKNKTGVKNNGFAIDENKEQIEFV